MTVRCLIGTGSSELVLCLSAVLEKFTDRGTVTVMPDCRELLRELRPCAGPRFAHFAPGLNTGLVPGHEHGRDPGKL